MLTSTPIFQSVGNYVGGMAGNFTLFGVGGLSLCPESALPMLVKNGLRRKYPKEQPPVRGGHVDFRSRTGQNFHAII